MPYLAVLAGAVLCYAALGAVLRILPQLESDHAAVGLLVGAPALAAVFTRPGGGRLADGLGPGRVMLAGAAFMAAGIAPALAASGFEPLLISRLLVGAGEGAMMSAAVLWLLRLAGPERRGRALGHIGLANYGGLTAGPLLASALGLARVPVLIAAAVLPLAGALVTTRAKRPPPEATRTRGDHETGIARAAILPGIGLMLVNVGYVALLAFGVTVSGSGLAIPVFATGVIVARTAFAGVPDRFGARRTVAASTTTAAVGLAIVALAPTTALALAGTLVLAVGQGLAVPALGLLVIGRVPAARHGAAAGLFFSFFDAGVGAGGPFVGWIARLTSPSGALLVAAGAVAGAGLVTGISRRW